MSKPTIPPPTTKNQQNFLWSLQWNFPKSHWSKNVWHFSTTLNSLLAINFHQNVNLYCTWFDPQVTESSKPPSVKSVLKKSLHKQHTDFWNSSLDKLQVQLKFKDIVALEPKSRTLNRLITGLPAGQLSFLLQPGTDCVSPNSSQST